MEGKIDEQLVEQAENLCDSNVVAEETSSKLTNIADNGCNEIKVVKSGKGPNCDVNISKRVIPENKVKSLISKFSSKEKNAPPVIQKKVAGKFQKDIISENSPIKQSDKESTKETDQIFSVTKVTFNEEKLSEVVKNLKETEMKYVNDLRHIVDVYMPHTEKNVSDKLKSKLPYIFSNITEIYAAAKDFLVELEECGENVEKVAKTFIKHENMFKMYPVFYKNKPIIGMNLEEFHSFAGQKQVNLKNYLYMPMERLEKYSTLLKNIREESLKNSSAPESILNALKIIDTQLLYAKQALTEKLPQQCALSVIDYGPSIKRGKFQSTDPPGTDYMIFLFKTTIVLTIIQTGHNENFVHASSMNVENLIVRCPENNPAMLELKNNDQKFLLLAQTSVIAKEWVEAVGELQETYNDDNMYVNVELPEKHKEFGATAIQKPIPMKRINDLSEENDHLPASVVEEPVPMLRINDLPEEKEQFGGSTAHKLVPTRINDSSEEKEDVSVATPEKPVPAKRTNVPKPTPRINAYEPVGYPVGSPVVLNDQLRKIIEKLLITERNYALSLDRLLNNYFPDIASKISLKHELLYLRGNLDDLHRLAGSFRSDLQKNSGDATKIVETFINHEDTFKEYSKLFKNKSKMDDFVKNIFPTIEGNVERIMDFAVCWLAPKQRLDVYKLTLANIEEEFVTLGLPTEKVRKAIQIVQTQITKICDFFAIDLIQSRPLNLVMSTYIRRDQFMQVKTKKPWMVFLFENVVVFTVIQKNGSFEYSDCIQMDNIKMTYRENDCNTLELVDYTVFSNGTVSQKIFAMVAPSAIVYQTWLQIIQEKLLRQQMELKANAENLLKRKIN